MINTINAIRETQGSNAKIDLLRNSDSELLRKVLLYTYNPFYRYNVKKFPSYQFTGKNTNTLNDFFTLLDELRKRRLTGNRALEEVVDTLSNMSKEDAELGELMLDRDLKFGLNSKSINKAFKNLIPTFDVMLADSGVVLDDLFSHNDFLFVQRKMDGKRCIAIVSQNSVDFYARSGKEMENLYSHESLINSLKHVRDNVIGYDFVLDGEIVMLDEAGDYIDRQVSNGMINRKNLTKDEVSKFMFIVWDMLSLAEFENNDSLTPYEERYYTLMHIFKSKFERVDVVDTWTSVDVECVNKLTNNFIKEGYEGSVVKTPHHFYRRKRSKDWVKFKVILECDLKVVDFEYGTPGSKNDGILGALVCESSDGKVKVNVGTGFSDAQRQEIKPENIVGEIVTVQYNELSEDANGNFSLFLPVFIEHRNDKDEADNFEKIRNNG